MVGRLIEAALALCPALGVGGLGARAVAARAGLSASAINYHLGGWNGLLVQLLGSCRDRLDQWAAVRAASPAPAEFANSALVSALICDLAAQPLSQALADFRDLVRRGALAGGGSADWLSMETVWRGLLAGRVETEEFAVWWVFAMGALPIAMIEADSVARPALVGSAAMRVGERLSGRRDFASAEPPAERSTAAESDPATPEGKLRLIEAAIRLIGELGVDGLTHRRLAAAAGLSLASTTYFFADKGEIVAEAFKLLHHRTIARIGVRTSAGATRLSQIMLTEDGTPRWEVCAMDALYRAAARDDGLRPFGQGLRQVRGLGSVRWLKSRGVAGADRMDGLIWSLFNGGLFTIALTLPARERAGFIDQTSEAIFNRLHA